MVKSKEPAKFVFFLTWGDCSRPFFGKPLKAKSLSAGRRAARKPVQITRAEVSSLLEVNLLRFSYFLVIPLSMTVEHWFAAELL